MNPFDMTRTRPVVLLSILLAGLAIAGCGPGTAQEAPADEEDEHAAIAVTRWADQMEVFFEHPPMIAGQQSAPWPVHVTELGSYAPVREGTLTLRFRAPDGRVYAVEAEGPARPGIFLPAPRLPEAGTYDLLIAIESPQVTDQVLIGELPVYESADAVPHADEAGAGGITFLKEQQWPMDFGVAMAGEREIPYSVKASGELVAAAGEMAAVAAPVSGLVLAEANLSAPAPGDWVQRGERLAVLSPVGGDNSYAQAKARAERLQREVEREERLFAVAAIPEKRLVESRHDLEVARAALEAMGGSSGDGYNFPVRAPISGVVSERHLAPGDRIEAGEPLFAIVNPNVVWLRLHVPARFAAQVGDATGASFTVKGSTRTYEAERVVSVGSVIDPATRTFPVTLAVDNADGSLKIGMLASARLYAGGTETGTAIPTAAVQDEDGLHVAYVQTGGETFERRVLRLGPSNGRYTLVQGGIQENEFVVTGGAYQVYLASLGADEVAGHGHAH